MTLLLFDQIAEARIEEALQRGELQGLAGEGGPLPLDDDLPWVPPELRMSYRILKNSGFLPEAVQLRRDLATAEALLLHAVTDEERAAAQKRLRLLLSKLNEQRGDTLTTQQAYFERLLERLDAAASVGVSLNEPR